MDKFQICLIDSIGMFLTVLCTHFHLCQTRSTEDIQPGYETDDVNCIPEPVSQTEVDTPVPELPVLCYGSVEVANEPVVRICRTHPRIICQTSL